MVTKKWIFVNNWTRRLAILVACFSHGSAHASKGFATNWGDTIYVFDPDNPSTPATAIVTTLSDLDCITISPDGTTVYFTSNNSTLAGGDVYSFPVDGPYVPTPLGTGVSDPIGIAISSDGTTGFITDDSNIWSFPIGGTNHMATQLTATGITISRPTFIAIQGETAYVAQYNDYMADNLFTFPVNSVSYDATVALSHNNTFSFNGLAISNDGYLYFTSNTNSEINAVVFQISLASLGTATPTPLSTQDFVGWDGLAVSADGKTVYATSLTNGIYTLPTNQGSMIPPTLLTGLDITSAIAVVISSALPDPSNLLPGPSNLVGVQKKNNFALVYELYNTLSWRASPGNTVVGYFIYRDGVKVANVNALTLTYKDHNRKESVAYTYSVTAFDASGNESSPISITIN